MCVCVFGGAGGEGTRGSHKISVLPLTFYLPFYRDAKPITTTNVNTYWVKIWDVISSSVVFYMYFSNIKEI